jgi:hypothetical protein
MAKKKADKNKKGKKDKGAPADAADSTAEAAPAAPGEVLPAMAGPPHAVDQAYKCTECCVERCFQHCTDLAPPTHCDYCYAIPCAAHSTTLPRQSPFVIRSLPPGSWLAPQPTAPQAATFRALQDPASGRQFFINTKTRQTVWNVPAGGQVVSIAPPFAPR